MDSHAEITITLRGEKRHFDLVVEPVRDAEGTIVGLLCSAIDITSLKETIARLQEALNEVQVLRGLLPTLLLQFRHDFGIRGVAVHVDHPRARVARSQQGVLEETLGGSGITSGCQQEIDRRTAESTAR
jgi:hypothetical protein